MQEIWVVYQQDASPEVAFESKSRAEDWIDEQREDTGKQYTRKKIELRTDGELVVLCSSPNFGDEYLEEHKRLTQEGATPIDPRRSGTPDGAPTDAVPSTADFVDDHTKRKLEHADRLHVLNFSGYMDGFMGEMISAARDSGLPITWVEQPSSDGGEGQ